MPFDAEQRAHERAVPPDARQLRRLEALWHVTTRPKPTNEEQGKAVLLEAVHALCVDGAWLSHRQGNEQVVEVIAGLSRVYRGLRVPYEQSPAAFAEAADGRATCDDSEAELSASDAAAARRYGYRSFIVQRFVAGGKEWTLTFAASEPRVPAFDDADRAYVALVVDYFVRFLERREWSERIVHLAYHDVLTGLPNRAQFYDRLDEAIAFARRNRRMTAIVYLDLNGFKEVNDRYGHQAGDYVLIEVAQRLRAVLRRNELLSRLGGDEFAILVPVLDGAQSLGHLRQRIGTALAIPLTHEGNRLAVSAALGIATYPTDGEQRADILACADDRMYAAKHETREQTHRSRRGS